MLSNASLKNMERLREEILRRLPDLTMPELGGLEEFIDSLMDDQVTVSAEPVMAKAV